MKNFAYSRVFALCFLPALLLAGGLELQAQSPSRGSDAKIELAGLHSRLVWQRSSPTLEKPDGPVLYQLLLNAGGTPGTIAMFDTNPRHLTDSPIIVGVNNVAIGGLSIDRASGILTFAANQASPEPLPALPLEPDLPVDRSAPAER